MVAFEIIEEDDTAVEGFAANSGATPLWTWTASIRFTIRPPLTASAVIDRMAKLMSPPAIFEAWEARLTGTR